MGMHIVWDESGGSIIIYPTVLGSMLSGIRRCVILETKTAGNSVVNTVAIRVTMLLGKDDTVRWMNLAIYQGQPTRTLNTVACAAGIQKRMVPRPNSPNVS